MGIPAGNPARRAVEGQIYIFFHKKFSSVYWGGGNSNNRPLGSIKKKEALLMMAFTNLRIDFVSEPLTWSLD